MASKKELKDRIKSLEMQLELANSLLDSQHDIIASYQRDFDIDQDFDLAENLFQSITPTLH